MQATIELVTTKCGELFSIVEIRRGIALFFWMIHITFIWFDITLPIPLVTQKLTTTILLNIEIKLIHVEIGKHKQRIILQQMRKQLVYHNVL